MSESEKISVWLDDHCNDGQAEARMTPQGWVGVATPQEVIDLLKTNTVARLSLDNDLGLFDDGSHTPWEGRHVLDWLERALVDGIVTEAPYIYIHTDNASAKLYMKKVARRIRDWEWAQREPKAQE